MKFAKELDDDLVPEWRSKYFNYKKGKKLIKAVSRALRDANRTTPAGLQPQTGPALPFTHFDFNQQRPHSASSTRSEPILAPENELENRPETEQENKLEAESEHGAGRSRQEMPRRQSMTMFAKSPPVMIPGRDGNDSGSESENASPERTPLRPSSTAVAQRYGSIVGTPPDEPAPLRTFQLPDPAMSPESLRKKQSRASENTPPHAPLPASAIGPSESPTAYHAGIQRRPTFAQRFLSQRHERAQSTPTGKPKASTKSRLHKMFKPHQMSPQMDDVQLEAYEKIDASNKEFFNFLDKELKKIEDFYKQKEDESTERLELLRQQLHELRDRRLAEIHQAQHGGDIEAEDGAIGGDITNAARYAANMLSRKQNGSLNPIKQFEGMVHKGSKVGRVTKSLQQHTSPSGPQGQPEDRGDYTRRRDHAPSYRVAKRRLKLALQEYYRGLELLKSYTLLNRTAFRKVNKKYDKAANARPTLRYYSEKVEKAYFVQSDTITSHIVAVEDLYARYFEKGNHKVAVQKLRSKLNKGDQSGVSFRNGLYIAAGTCFAIAGLTTSVRRLFDPDPDVATEASYLMQLYGGYFLALLLFLFFVIDCSIWTTNRINYQFVFEYDARHTLDWRQLAEIPCFFLFLNGLFLFLNFQQASDDPFFRYWFVILISITLGIMALPFKVLYYESRRWWGYSNWRLFFAGLYPVEFRDFYLGDMYCSATYTMSQIEVFFCLYANDWTNPKQCNSGHSRLLGFFAALPAVWRALQCIRRYKDSGKWFPHLANFAKYMGNVLYYMTLSMYRIELRFEYKVAFAIFAAINGFYCSVWDIFMDWSLGDWWSSGHWFLRPRLAYKRKWVYYAAMIVDVVLRQQWIFYVIFTEDVQHNTAVSFFVALAEVLRRGIWSIFRVENEHCNNVGNYRASRDIPLPYKLHDDLSDLEERPSQETSARPTPAISATGADVERTATTDSSIRQRRPPQTPTFRALQRVGTMIAGAHAQDFEKKRRPVEAGLEEEAQGGSSDEEDDDDDADMATVRGDNDDNDDVETASQLVGNAVRGSVA